MNKVSFLRLWDLYNGLLTPTQQDITNLYFNLDLTLSEIAEQRAITRQGVSECLKTSKKQLEEFEKKLRFSENLTEFSLEKSFMMNDARRWAEKFVSAHPEFAKEIAELETIILKDYSAEVKDKLKDPAVQGILNSGFTSDVSGDKSTNND